MSRFDSDADGNSRRRPLTREDVLGVRDVAALLGLPRSTVHDLARRGLLPARRVGRRWLFVRDRVEAALIPIDDATAWRPATDDPGNRGNGRRDS